jgi:hypothetical protein
MPYYGALLLRCISRMRVNAALFAVGIFAVLVALYYIYLFCRQGHAVAWLVEALCYKPEGYGSDSR